MFVLTAAKTIVFCGIFGRLVSLQINEATKYKTLSDKNRFREWKLAPQRGVIRDYFEKTTNQILAKVNKTTSVEDVLAETTVSEASIPVFSFTTRVHDGHAVTFSKLQC